MEYGKGYGKEKGYGKGKGKGWSDDSYMWQMMEQMMMWKGKGKGKGKDKGYDKGYGKGYGYDKGYDKGKGKGKGKSKMGNLIAQKKADAAQKTEQASRLPWKTRLSQAYSKKHKKCPSKDTLVYESQEVGDNFTASVTCAEFGVQTDYASDSAQATKKQAEESAAMVALQAEFPDVFEQVPDEEKLLGADVCLNISAAKVLEPIAPRLGEKRKADLMSDGADAKCRLNSGIMILNGGRSFTKSEVVFTTTEDANGDLVGHVEIKCLEEPQSFSGEPVKNERHNVAQCKKLAIFGAAQVALDALQESIAEKMPEHEAMKAANKVLREARQAEEQAKK